MYHQRYWTEEKIAQRLTLVEPLVYRVRVPLAPFRFLALDGPLVAPPVSPDEDRSAWEPLAAETAWGRWQLNFVLHTQFAVPEAWPVDVPVGLYLPLGVRGTFSHPEALAYIDGQPYATADRHHQEILLPAAYCDGQSHDLALHGWTGYPDSAEAGPYMRECSLVQIDQPTRDFVTLARVALGTARLLEEVNPARDRLFNALDEAFKMLDLRVPMEDAFYASVAPAYTALQAGIAQAGAPLDVNVIGAGHAHIDVAWLWTLGQTRRKAGRTFHNVLRLMEQFPEYTFTQSQPQLYEFVRQDYPDLFAAIQERVTQGRWEPIGGMWVEADCNLSGPESLARQFLLGRRYFQKHFGEDAESPVLWLPDVFGYAWALPQLIKQAGLDYFFTIKIGWNQYNRLPFDSFWWQGIDGTRVLTHFSTTPEDHDINSRATYNAVASPAAIYGTWLNSQHKEAQPTHLMSYGFGDGGGGPTREMLENIRELAAFPGMPRTRTGRVRDFFRQLEAEAGERLPTWNGELYLELHRGTYTTQGRNKQANRKSEFLLHDAEALAALAAVLDPDYAYPTDTFERAWELVCLNQFHDIIPGSSIGEVYTESLAQYATVFQSGLAAREAALAAIGDRVGGDLVVANTTGFARDDLFFWPETLPEGHHLTRVDGTLVYTQPAEDGVWISPGQIAPYSVLPLVITAGAEHEPNSGVKATPTLLENDYLRVSLDDAGDIVRIYDRVNRREVLPDGMVANEFQAFEDRPLNWDAWDIDSFFEDKQWLAEPADSVQVVASGPLRATLEIKRRILNSTYTQRISLVHNSPCLMMTTTIDWQERDVLLKAAFPVDVLAPQATYEIQFGNVQRPTHRNTSWDWARFETVAQKWVDLSEGGYGVSLLNDCKYGHDIRDNVIRASLLRSPSRPDPEADRGQHTFTLALLPHAGGWDERTVAAAYALNDPLVVGKGPGDVPQRPLPFNSFVQVDQPHVVIETVKQAEDGRGVIVRLYENQRRRGVVSLTTGFPLGEVWRTNLLEEDEANLSITGRKVLLNIKPYQIMTLRLIPAQDEN